MGTPTKLNTETPRAKTDQATMVGATKSRARAVVFEFARPARDEHRTSRVERGLSITGMHSRMNTNSSSASLRTGI